MSMYNLLYSENYAKISASLWQYCNDEPNENITDFIAFKFKSSITDNANNAGIANVKIVVSLKFLSNFSMPLINCKVTFDLDWSENLVICEANRATKFAMTSTKTSVVTLSTQDNAKLLQHLKSVFKRIIN